jgi:hypothetical protein
MWNEKTLQAFVLRAIWKMFAQQGWFDAQHSGQ